MKKLIPAAILAATTLLAPLAAHAQTSKTYTGNGATGFGGEIGLGTITVSETSAGAITFGLALGNGKTSQDNNVSIYYIDSVAGGFQNTSTLHDTGTNSDGIGITGGNGSTVAYFAPGFQADYAVAFQDGYLDLFKLNTDGTITYLNGNGNPAAPNAYQFTFNAADIGTTATTPFSFVGTLLSTPYRSNETFGTSTVVVDPSNPGAAPNAGAAGSVTFSNFNTFAPAAAPEPGSMVPLAMGALALGGLVMARRRRTATAAE